MVNKTALLSLAILLIPLSLAQAGISSPNGIPPIEVETSAELMAFLQIEGDIEDSKDTFKAIVHIRNVGDVTAENVEIKLQNIPKGWEVFHDNLESTPGEQMNIGDVEAGTTKRGVFKITRNEEDASIFAIVSADNSNSVSSEVIPIPIHPIVIISFFLIALALYFMRR